MQLKHSFYGVSFDVFYLENKQKKHQTTSKTSKLTEIIIIKHP